jgi:hypothetical protein
VLSSAVFVLTYPRQIPSIAPVKRNHTRPLCKSPLYFQSLHTPFSVWSYLLQNHNVVSHDELTAMESKRCTKIYGGGGHPITSSLHFVLRTSKSVGAAGGVEAMASNSGYCCRSGSGTGTFEPFRRLMSCRALTTPLPR